MEFTNEIFFNKPLIAGSTVIITYCGKLYREHSKDVSIVFGYGENWNETDNAPMVETENGFEVTLTIKDYNTFNFCFTNSFNIWDNNFGNNYIASIEPKQEEISEETQEQAENQEAAVEDAKETNDNNNDDNTPKADGLSDTLEEGASSVVEEAKEETEEEEKQEENETKTETDESSASFEVKEQNAEIEAAFSSLLDSILDDTKTNESVDISDLSSFGLQSIDEIKEEDIINCDKIFAELFEELTLDDKKKENIDQANAVTEEKEIREAEMIDYEKYDAQELDSLMDNLLLSISENPETSNYATPVQQAKEQDLENEVVGLPVAKENGDWVDKIVNISYNFSKKIATAFKKFGNLVKLKAKDLGIIHDDK